MAAHDSDAVAVQQDAASVHALATRAFAEVDMHDPAIAILAAWAADIDAGIDEAALFVMPAATRSAGLAGLGVSDSRGRRTALIAGSTVFALVVSGGAAAAVTGDPLAMVRGPLHALGKVNPFADTESNARERLPEQAPTTADANKLLADAQRAVANGDMEKAQQLLTEAQALMGGAANPGQQNRIDKLIDDLSGKPGDSGEPGKPNDPGKPSDPGDPGQGPKGAGDPEGKGPADKTTGPENGSKGSNDPEGPDDKGPADKSQKESSTEQPANERTDPPKDEQSSEETGSGSAGGGRSSSDKDDQDGADKGQQSPKAGSKG